MAVFIQNSTVKSPVGRSLLGVTKTAPFLRIDSDLGDADTAASSIQRGPPAKKLLAEGVVSRPTVPEGDGYEYGYDDVQNMIKRLGAFVLSHHRFR